MNEGLPGGYVREKAVSKGCLCPPLSCVLCVKLLRTAVVWSLACDRYIVRMALEYASIGDAYKLSVVKLLDGGSATVTHTSLEATSELIDYLVE